MLLQILYVLLYIGIVILVVWFIIWVLGKFGIALSPRAANILWGIGAVIAAIMIVTFITNHHVPTFKEVFY